VKLSTNFHLSEITSLPVSSIPGSRLHLMLSLCKDILQPIRDFLGVPVKVTSGMRDMDEYHRLIKKGYYPSETSDHFFGVPVPIRKKYKRSKYGSLYTLSVGAVDIVPAGGASRAFKRLILNANEEDGTITLPFSGGDKKISIGQMILEKRRSYWIHISNSPLLVYSQGFVDRYLRRTHFLESLDNGQTYRRIL